jgi:hypothetical protein
MASEVEVEPEIMIDITRGGSEVGIDIWGETEVGVAIEIEIEF